MIIERRGDKWTAIVNLPPDPITGARRRKRITDDTKKGVELKAAAALQQAAGGLVTDDRITVAEFFTNWIDATEHTRKASTHRRYRDLARLHILPVIGSRRLVKLTPGDIQSLHADRLRHGLSATSVRHVHVLLHHILRDAVDWGLLLRNVAASAKAPKASRPESKTWSPQEVDRVLSEALNTPDAALWTLALFTGMRRGELLGLRWSDIDLNAHSLSVQRSLSRGSDSRLVEGTPKTAKGRRRISLAPIIVDALRRHRADQNERRLKLGELYENQDLVFPGEFGRPMHPNTFTRRFKSLVESTGVTMIRVHDLRHTSATLLLRQGAHPKIVQERLGHADISMTLDLYSHVTADMQAEAAMQLETLFTAAKRDAS